FPKPLDSPEYCFYLTTETCGAARLRFDDFSGHSDPQRVPAPPKTPDAVAVLRARLDAGDSAAMLPLFEAARDESEPMMRDSREALRPVAAHVAIVTGSSVQRLL